MIFVYQSLVVTNTMERTERVWSLLPILKCWFQQLLAEQYLLKNLIPLCLDFPMCKIGIMITGLP